MCNQKTTGNNQFLKEFNKTAVLDLIRTENTMSKIELAKTTGLSPTAIGDIVDNLEKEGYISETGHGKSSGGRRPVQFSLNPKSFYSIGFDFDVEIINAALTDITGDIICLKSAELSCWNDPSDSFSQMQHMKDQIMEEYNIDCKQLLGIGISIPGLIHHKNKSIVLAPNLGWKDIEVNKYFDLSNNLYIENEALASAVCENWVGTCRGRDNFVCINMKSGIGAGIFVGGLPYRGAIGAAGEIGHLQVQENGPKCGCGKYGCLEASLKMSTIQNPANMRDQGTYLGSAISDLINILNPEHIVLGKDFIKYPHFVIETIRQTVNEKVLGVSASILDISTSTFGEYSSAIGVALIPIKQIFGK